MLWLWRHRLLVLLVVGVPIGLAACGHAIEALTFHRHGIWCAFHGWRAYHDLKTHHPFWGAFQLWRAAHHCGRVL
jgi:hypothetical protein